MSPRRARASGAACGACSSGSCALPGRRPAGEALELLLGEAVGHAREVVAHRALAADLLDPAAVPGRHLVRARDQRAEEALQDLGGVARELEQLRVAVDALVEEA